MDKYGTRLQPQPQNFRENVTICLIAYGSNLSNALGESQKITNLACERLAERGIRILQRSGDFRSPAWPPGSGPDFVNGVILGETACDAAKVLAILHEVEAGLGRTRRKRWEARVIDLDLIDFGGQVLPDVGTWTRWADLAPDRQQAEAPEALVLPHPRVQDRPFVLVPLGVVAPDWAHPVTGMSVRAMIEALEPGRVAEVRRLPA